MSELTTLEQFNKMTQRIKDIDEEIDELRSTQQTLGRQRKEMVGQIIIEEELLNEQPWQMMVGDNQHVWLDGGYSKDDKPNRPKLFKILCATSWGDFDFECKELNITIRGSDGESTITFYDVTKAVETIKLFNIEVDFSAVQDKVKEAKVLADLWERASRDLQAGRHREEYGW